MPNRVSYFLEPRGSEIESKDNGFHHYGGNVHEELEKEVAHCDGHHSVEDAAELVFGSGDPIQEAPIVGVGGPDTAGHDRAHVGVDHGHDVFVVVRVPLIRVQIHHVDRHRSLDQDHNAYHERVDVDLDTGDHRDKVFQLDVGDSKNLELVNLGELVGEPGDPVFRG